MKPQAEYTITYVGEFKLSGKARNRVYKVTKFLPPDQITEYEVTRSKWGDGCTCPAGRRPDCKHRQMVREKDNQWDD